MVSAIPQVTITDISHCLPSQNYLPAAYICKNAFRFYPDETFHMVIVNMFQSTPGHLLIAKYNNQYIACADNGLLTMITGEKPSIIISLPVPPKKFMVAMHCTQVWVNAFQKISQGIPIEKLGTPSNRG